MKLVRTLLERLSLSPYKLGTWTGIGTTTIEAGLKNKAIRSNILAKLLYCAELEGAITPAEVVSLLYEEHLTPADRAALKAKHKGIREWVEKTKWTPGAGRGRRPGA